METTITAAMTLVQTSAMGWQSCSPRIPLPEQAHNGLRPEVKAAHRLETLAEADKGRIDGHHISGNDGHCRDGRIPKEIGRHVSGRRVRNTHAETEDEHRIQDHV